MATQTENVLFEKTTNWFPFHPSVCRPPPPPPTQTVLVSSDAPGADHAVRYLSLYDNRFLRFFNGHTDKVVSIAMSPTDDHFMTGSLDRQELRLMLF